MARYAIVRHGFVENVVELEEVTANGWQPSEGTELVQHDAAGPGWSYTGGEFAPPASEVEVPGVVSPRQMRLAMLAAGVLPQVQGFVDGPDASEAVRIAWEYATEFHRGDPMIAALAPMLQPPMTPADIDDLFRAAAEIQ